MKTWLIAAAAIALAACATSTTQQGDYTTQSRTGAGPTAEELINDHRSAGDVLTYGMGYHQQRYSPLTQINRSTVKRLVPVWSVSLANEFGEQGQPLVYDGVLYAANVKRVVAVEAATGKQLWMTEIPWDPAAARIVCCGLSNRGIALYNGKVFVASLDAHIMALDQKTGKEVWKTKVTEWKDGYSITSAPTVANGVLMTGMTGGEFGVRGFIDGYNPETGKRLWRRHTTAGPGEKGGDTWPKGDAYMKGGASTWITGSYDPELDLVYWGTSNGGPWTATPRPGDNLYVASVIAFRPKTGAIVWHYQWTPAETYDFDGNNENVLADIMVNGEKRKVLMHADRNGFLYTLDRASGKLISGNPYVKVNWASHIDLTTGRPVETEVGRKLRAGEKVVVEPRWTGGKNWMPMAFNPNTGKLYMSMLEEASIFQLNKELPVYKPGERYIGATYTTADRDPNTPWGYYGAVDPLTGKSQWRVPLVELASWSGMLSTAGGLVFTGKASGEFLAIDEATGNILWQFRTSSGINAQPITYAIDGRQYVSVLSGLGGGTSSKRGTQGKVQPGGSIWTFALME